jgi:PAS domain S-box-containing protein
MHTKLAQGTIGYVLEESASDAYVFDATDCHFVFVNRGARDNLGYAMSELAELTPWDLKPNFSRAAFLELVAPLRRGKQQSITFETVHRRKDGSDYDAFVNLQVINTEPERLFYAAIQDISERKSAERGSHDGKLQRAPGATVRLRAT